MVDPAIQVPLGLEDVPTRRTLHPLTYRRSVFIISSGNWLRFFEGSQGIGLHHKVFVLPTVVVVTTLAGISADTFAAAIASPARVTHQTILESVTCPTVGPLSILEARYGRNSTTPPPGPALSEVGVLCASAGSHWTAQRVPPGALPLLRVSCSNTKSCFATGELRRRVLQFLPLRTAAKLGTPRRYRQTSFCWMAKGSRARLRRTLLLGAPIASKKSSSLPRRMVASRGLTVERGVRVSHWNFVCDNNELCRCRDEWPKRLLRGGGSQHTGRWYRLGISHPEPFADQEGPRRPVVRRRVMSEHGRLCRY